MRLFSCRLSSKALLRHCQLLYLYNLFQMLTPKAGAPVVQASRLTKAMAPVTIFVFGLQLQLQQR
jgi:hypothetical protein